MPDWSGAVRRRLAPLGLPPTREAEIIEELAAHLDQQWRELTDGGVSAETAHAQVMAELEGDELLERALREVVRRAPPEAAPVGAERDAGWGDRLRQDARQALRMLRLKPGFTIVALLTLALGIGANTAIFGVVKTVLLRPLPYPEPQRLVTFWLTAPEKGLPRVAVPEGIYLIYRDRTRVMESVAAYTGDTFTLSQDGGPERVEGAWVSSEFFRVMETPPERGRVFTARQARAISDGIGAVMLSHALWERRFGGDSAVIGRTVRINDAPVVVTGVMPPDFGFPRQAALWVPLAPRATKFNCWCWDLVGRVKPGFTADDVRRDVATMTDHFGLERRDVFPDARPGGTRVVAMPLHDLLVEDVRNPLLIVFGAGGVALLIACANLANLLLARGAGRRREIALRCCFGASGRRIIEQLFTESLVLALLGAAGGAALAVGGIALFRSLRLEQIPRMADIHLDAGVLGFSVGLSVLTAIVFGLVPALRAARVELQPAVHGGARAGTDAGHRRLTNAFVVSQFALSLVLLVGAGLALKSFRKLLGVDPGYRLDHTLIARVALPYPRFANDTTVRAFYGQLLSRVRALPGVRQAGAASLVPLPGGNSNTQDNIIAEGQEPVPGQPVLVANIRSVTPGYFAAIGTPLLSGREFTPADDPAAPRVALVDDLFARHFWPGQDALGKRFRRQGDTSSTRWRTIVGVVPNVKHSGPAEQPSLQEYEAFAQQTTWMSYLVIHTGVPPTSLVGAVRAQLAALDPTIPLFEVHTMQNALDQALATRRLADRLLAGFAACALLLAAIGIYGVISLNVNGRFREFGVRLALGAHPAVLLRMVLRQGVMLAALGVGIGLVGAAWLTRYLESLLFEVPPLDPATFLVVSGLLAGVGLLACLGPARRATRADPVSVLGAE